MGVTKFKYRCQISCAQMAFFELYLWQTQHKSISLSSLFLSQVL